MTSNRTSCYRLPCAAESVDEFLSEPTPGVLAAASALSGPVLVLGAGGKLGLHISIMLDRALKQVRPDNQVTAVSRFRTLRDRNSFERHGISTRICDLGSPTELEQLPEAKAVIFLAGVKFGTSNSPTLLQKVNVELPRMVARRFHSSRIVALSTGCIYPFLPPSSGGATEETLPAPVGDYARSCLERERAFSAISYSHRTPVALIRLNYAVEFRYGILVDIAERVLNGQPIDVTTGYANVIWQRDAVAHCLQSILLASSPACILNVTGASVIRIRDIASQFGRLFERKPIFVGEEQSTAWLSNATRAHRILGEPATSVPQMIEWIAAWLLDGKNTWGKPTHFESRTGSF